MEFDYFVTPQWLFEHHDAQDLVIVDVSAPMPTQDIDYHQRYLERHIPGAHFFDLDETADKTTSLPHMLPSDTLFSETLKAVDAESVWDLLYRCTLAGMASSYWKWLRHYP